MPWISFDLDGTLAAWPFQRVVIPELLRYVRHPELARAYVAEATRRLHSGAPETAFEMDEIFAALWEQLGLSGPFPTALEICERATFGSELLYPDVHETLAWLRGRGWRVAVSTNGHSRYQRLALRALGIEADAVLSTDTARAVKPQAQFLQKLPALSGDPDALAGLIHVGDRLLEDVLGAHRAGVRAAWLWREMPDDLRELSVADRQEVAVQDGTLAAALEAEAGREGRVGFHHDGAAIMPDLLLASLSELPPILEASLSVPTHA